MQSADVFNEMKEVNLAYLMLAQQMLRQDRETTMFRLGIGAEVADLLQGLTSGQVLKMAASNMLLCRFRFDDRLLIELLSDRRGDTGASHLHAAILAAGQPVESLA